MKIGHGLHIVLGLLEKVGSLHCISQAFGRIKRAVFVTVCSEKQRLLLIAYLLVGGR